MKLKLLGSIALLLLVSLQVSSWLTLFLFVFLGTLWLFFYSDGMRGPFWLFWSDPHLRALAKQYGRVTRVYSHVPETLLSFRRTVYVSDPEIVEFFLKEDNLSAFETDKEEFERILFGPWTMATRENRPTVKRVLRRVWGRRCFSDNFLRVRDEIARSWHSLSMTKETLHSEPFSFDFLKRVVGTFVISDECPEFIFDSVKIIGDDITNHFDDVVFRGKTPPGKHHVLTLIDYFKNRFQEPKGTMMDYADVKDADTLNAMAASFVVILMGSVGPMRAILTAGLAHLHDEPSLLERLEHEAETLGGAKDISGLNTMKLLDAFTRELLRLYTIGGAIRCAPETLTVNGRRFWAGDMIFLDIGEAFHKNPQFYPNWKTLDPSRWQRPESAKPPYYPFYAGEKRCPGENITYWLTKLIFHVYVCGSKRIKIRSTEREYKLFRGNHVLCYEFEFIDR